MVDLSIEEVLPDILKLMENPIGIVRSVDSAKSSDDLEMVFKFHDIEYEYKNSNFVIHAPALEDAINKILFTGFDELWLFETRMPDYSLANLPCSTSDGTFFNEGVEEDLIHAFKKSGAKIMLADGIGLNVLYSDKKFKDAFNLWIDE